MKDNQLAKLIKKNAAKVDQAAKQKKGKFKDPTLAATRPPGEADDDDSSVERTHFFKEMKRREF